MDHLLMLVLCFQPLSSDCGHGSSPDARTLLPAPKLSSPRSCHLHRCGDRCKSNAGMVLPVTLVERELVIRSPGWSGSSSQGAAPGHPAATTRFRDRTPLQDKADFYPCRIAIFR